MYFHKEKQPIAAKLFNELQQKKDYKDSLSHCKDLLKIIENTIQRRVIVYFSHPKSQLGVTDGDVDFIEDLLRCENPYLGLTLILNSPGGQAVAAEKIVNTCRAYASFYKTDFHVLVPKMAKSAATILALGSDKILLTKTAELGPIDPQLVLTATLEIGKAIKRYKKIIDNPKEQLEENKKIPMNIEEEDKKFKTSMQVTPAFRIVAALNSLLKESNKLFKFNKTAYNQFLEQYNYDVYEMSKNEIELTKDILKKYQKEKELKFSKNLSEDFKVFVDPTVTRSHNRTISLSELKNNQLQKVGFIEDLIEYYKKTLQQESDVKELDNLLWEYYMITYRYLEDDANFVRKVIDSTRGGFMFP